MVLLILIELKAIKQRYSDKYRFSYKAKNKNELFNRGFYIDFGRFFSSIESYGKNIYSRFIVKNNTENHELFCSNKNLSASQLKFFKKRLIHELFLVGFVYSVKNTDQSIVVTLISRKGI